MGNKKANRKAVKGELFCFDEDGVGVFMPACVKGATPRHADWFVPRPPKKGSLFRPSRTFSMQMGGAHGARVDEQPAELAVDHSSLSESSPLLGSIDDEDLEAGREKLSRILVRELSLLRQDCPHDPQPHGQVFGEPLTGQFIVDPLPGFPNLRFQRMSDEEARSVEEGESHPVWLRPTKFAWKTEAGIVWCVCAYHSSTVHVLIPGEDGKLTEKVTDKKTYRDIVVEAFLRASQDPVSLRAVNAVFLLCGRARDAAYKSGQEKRFAEAMANYVRACRALSYPTLSLDIDCYSMLSGEAFELASVRPEVSREEAQELRGKAVVAFKEAVTEGMRSRLVHPKRVADRWSALGQALTRAGDVAMAACAFHWGVHVARHTAGVAMPEIYATLLQNLAFLGEMSQVEAEEQEEYKRCSLENHAKEAAKNMPKLSFGRCRACFADTDKRCACKKEFYCSRACQKQDWARHKPHCNLKPTPV